MANQALRLIGKKVASLSPSNQLHEPGKSPSIKLFARSAIDTRIGIRLIGRLGKDVDYLVDEIPVEEFRLIDNSRTTFAELRWGAKAEGVVHLDDLLLRRVRLGITLPGGGLSIIQRIKEIVTEELYWDEPRWQEELTKYKQLLSDRYSVRF
jgi:glycerol-3-phosphate dehydrogenase